MDAGGNPDRHDDAERDPSHRTLWRVDEGALARLEESPAWQAWSGAGRGWTPADVYGPTAPLGFHWGVVHETEKSLFIALCENMGGGIPMAVIRALVDAARTTVGEPPNLRS